MNYRYLKDVSFSLLTFFLLIISVNIFLFPDSPGFQGLNPHPYLIVVLLVASRFGRWEGLVAAFISGLILVVYAYLDSAPYFNWSMLTEASFLISLVSFLLAALIVGEMRGFNKSFERAIVKENSDLKKENSKLKEQLEIITIIKEELENRIVGQEETVHSLYQATKSLETLDEKQFYSSLTQLTSRFTGATKVSLYVIDYPNDNIIRVARYGYEDSEDVYQKLPLKSDIFGMILNSNKLMTIKDISDDDKIFDTWQKSKNRAYAYVPISMGSVIVGILTVDDIPFLKLNISTIRILAMIAELAVPALKNIIKYQDLQDMVKIDPITNLTKYYSFETMANVEFTKAARYKLEFAILIIKVDGFEVIEQKLGHAVRVEAAKWQSHTFQTLLRTVDILASGKHSSEFIMSLPFTNTDGLLTVIDRIKKIQTQDGVDNTWNKYIKLSFGAATYHPSIKSFGDMLNLAYHSLELNSKTTQVTSEEEKVTKS